MSERPAHPEAYLDWRETAVGEHVTGLETAALEDAVSRVFGHYLIQVGDAFPTGYMGSAYVRRRFVFGQDFNGGGYPGGKSEVGRLPIATKSVDALVLPHVLEFTSDPYQVLREVDRVLVDDGQLFIVSFNRLGWWGLKQSLVGRRRVPFIGDPFRVDRVVDWMGVLGFELESVTPMMFMPKGMRRLPLLHQLAARGLPFFAGVCLIAGRKRVAPLTPVRGESRAARQLVPVGLGKPAARTEVEKRSEPS